MHIITHTPLSRNAMHTLCIAHSSTHTPAQYSIIAHGHTYACKFEDYYACMDTHTHTHTEHLRECEEKMPSLTASEAKKVFTRLREVRT